MNGDSSAISTGLSTAKTDDGDVVITANTAVTVAQFNLLDAATSSAIVLSGGISDTAANLAPSGTASSGLTSSLPIRTVMLRLQLLVLRRRLQSLIK